MTEFILREIRQCVQDGIIIFLKAADTVRLFGENLKLYRIAAVPQYHRRPRLILNLLAKSDKCTPSANDTTDMEIAPASMQFGRAFPCIIQAIWESDPVKVPVWVSKLFITESYHRGTLRLAQVVSFAYVILSEAEDDFTIICIDLVLPM